MTCGGDRACHTGGGGVSAAVVHGPGGGWQPVFGRRAGGHRYGALDLKPPDPEPLRQVVSAVLPCVKDLAADGSQYVRTALAGVVMEMAPALGKAATIEHLLPVFLSLLKDDFPDVRLNIIAKLDQARSFWGLYQAQTSTVRSPRQSIMLRWLNRGGNASGEGTGSSQKPLSKSALATASQVA